MDINSIIQEEIEDYRSNQEFYHGTNKKFSRFDTSKVGTGQEVEAHGFGFYFTSNKDIAEFYAKDLAGKNEPAYVYTVRVFNKDFFEWDDIVDHEKAERILSCFKNLDGFDEVDINDMEDALGLSDGYYGHYSQFSSIYDLLKAFLGSSRKASEFFSDCGFDGIVFDSKESGYQVKNYTIFDSGNIKIIDVEKVN